MKYRIIKWNQILMQKLRKRIMNIRKNISFIRRKQKKFHQNEQNMNSILRIIASRKIMQL